MPAVREPFLAITDRFAAYQAQCFNVHVDFPLSQRSALPIQVGTVKFPGILEWGRWWKRLFQDTRMIWLAGASSCVDRSEVAGAHCGWQKNELRLWKKTNRSATLTPLSIGVAVALALPAYHKADDAIQEIIYLLKAA
jgi:hypothetical protein